MSNTRYVVGTMQECLRALSQKGLAERDRDSREEWTRVLLAGEEAMSIWEPPSRGWCAERIYVVRARLRDKQ